MMANKERSHYDWQLCIDAVNVAASGEPHYVPANEAMGTSGMLIVENQSAIDD